MYYRFVKAWLTRGISKQFKSSSQVGTLDTIKTIDFMICFLNSEQIFNVNT